MACKEFQFKSVFQALYLFAFFSVLRISNILLHTITSFDSTRQLWRGDVIFAPQHPTIIIKWSKTLQDRKTSTTNAIPVLGDSLLCPVKALKYMLHIIPGDKNDLLFQVISAGCRISLTDSATRKHLKNIFLNLKISPALPFQVSGKQGQLGASNMEFLYRTLCSMGLGSRMLCGDIYPLTHLNLSLCLQPFVNTQCHSFMSSWCLG